MGKSCGLASEIDSERDVDTSHAIKLPTTLVTATTAAQPRTCRSVAKKEATTAPIAINSNAIAIDRRAFGFPFRLFKRSALTLLGRRVGSGMLQWEVKGNVYRADARFALRDLPASTRRRTARPHNSSSRSIARFSRRTLCAGSTNGTERVIPRSGRPNQESSSSQ